MKILLSGFWKIEQWTSRKRKKRKKQIHFNSEWIPNCDFVFEIGFSEPFGRDCAAALRFYAGVRVFLRTWKKSPWIFFFKREILPVRVVVSSPWLVQRSAFASSNQRDHNDSKSSPPEPLVLSQLSISPAAIEGTVVGWVRELEILVEVLFDRSRKNKLKETKLTNCRGISILDVW